MPCTSALTTTTKKTRSNTGARPGAPASTGNVASMMGTAPRSPTQETNAISRSGNRNGRRQREHDHRARDEREEEAEREPRPGDRREPGREREQAEQEEHRDLAEPGHRVVHAPEAGRVRERAVPEDDAADVDRDEAAPAEQRRRAEREAARARA